MIGAIRAGKKDVGSTDGVPLCPPVRFPAQVIQDSGAHTSRMSRTSARTADPQTRQRLETETLQEGYRAASKALEQEVRVMLRTDPDVRAKIDGYNLIIVKDRQKYRDMETEVFKSVDSFAAKHSRKGVDWEKLADGKSIFPDTSLMKEVQVQSVSDTPTSIHTDNEDLLQRYRADVNMTLSLVTGDGKGYPTKEQFVASANPQKEWKFPSVIDVKQRILAAFDQLSRTVENRIDLELSKQKLELESTLRKAELESLNQK
jgi:hypothetical protein